MSLFGGGLKDRKTLVTCIAIIVLAAIALVLIFSGGEREVDGPVILASKRVKLTAEERKVAAEVKSAPKAPEKAAKPAPAKKPVVKKKAPAKKKAVAKKKPAPKKAVAKKPAVKKAVARKAPPKKKVPKKAATTSSLTASLPWAINLASFSKLSAAEALVVKLKASGYNAYTTEFVKDGRNWNRVRIGFFKSREDALKSADMLSKRMLVKSKPWVVKPQTDEIIKFTR